MIEEKIYYEGHPVMFKNRPIFFIFSVILSIIGIGLVILLIWFLKTKAIKLTITEEKVILREGLLSKNLTEIFIEDVKRVQCRQTFLQRFFDVGSVTIASAATGYTEIIVGGIENPEEAKNLIIGKKNKRDE